MPGPRHPPSGLPEGAPLTIVETQTSECDIVGCGKISITSMEGVDVSGKTCRIWTCKSHAKRIRAGDRVQVKVEAIRNAREVAK